MLRLLAGSEDQAATCCLLLTLLLLFIWLLTCSCSTRLPCCYCTLLLHAALHTAAAAVVGHAAHLQLFRQAALTGVHMQQLQQPRKLLLHLRGVHCSNSMQNAAWFSGLGDRHMGTKRFNRIAMLKGLIPIAQMSLCMRQACIYAVAWDVALNVSLLMCIECKWSMHSQSGKGTWPLEAACCCCESLLAAVLYCSAAAATQRQQQQQLRAATSSMRHTPPQCIAIAFGFLIHVAAPLQEINCVADGLPTN
jgi:hypothetical protein